MKKKYPWDRWAERGETVRAHALFMIYVGLGPHRTYALTAKQAGKTQQAVANFGTKYRWIRRSKAYDQYLRDMAHKATEAQVKNDAILFAQREADYRHKHGTSPKNSSPRPRR